MSVLVEIMTAAGAATLTFALGVLALLLVLGFAVLRYRSTRAHVGRLLDLALSGRADEARIQARRASRDLSPVLEAMSGEIAPPRGRSKVRDALLLLLVSAPFVVFSGHALRTLGSDPKRVEAASLLLIGAAVLLPLSFSVAFTILTLGRQSSRVVRGSCIAVLARNVKNAIDLEIAEVQRKGTTNTRDPRGE